MTITEQIRTLANPVRLEILEVLNKSGKMPASDIIGHVNDEISASQLSQHLSKLRLNKLVTTEDLKGKPQYSINREAVSSVLHRLEALG